MIPVFRAFRLTLFHVSAFLAALGAASAGGCGQSPASSVSAPSSFEIRLNVPPANPAEGFIEVSGIGRVIFARLRKSSMSEAGWTALLRVSVKSDEDPRAQPIVQSDQPAMLGSHSVQAGAIRFTPRFPFDPGRPYEVVFDPSRLPGERGGREPSAPLVAVVRRPKPLVAPSTEVTHVYPSADVVPENLLRLYIHFSAPMSRRSGLDYIHLLDQKGHEVKGPFLPLDTDFWSDDRTRYTVFFDPGRVKQDLLPRREMGPSLEAGRQYTLVVDAQWPDGQGLALKQAFRRRFRVSRSELRPLEPRSWLITPPAAGTRDGAAVTFPHPLDHGLLLRALGISKAGGPILEGAIRVEASETRWVFVPRDVWTAGEYQLVALSILEDSAGNRIGRPFEVDRFDHADRTPEPERTHIPFRIATRDSLQPASAGR